MPREWTEQQDSAYNSIMDNGVAVRIFLNEKDNPSTNPNRPWEGSKAEPKTFDTYGVFLPFGGDLTASSRPNVAKVLLPAKGMDFEPTGDMHMQIIQDDGKGIKYKISFPTVLAPDPTQPIMYTVQAELWPS